ncbi:response regulator transcription factor ['Paenibacillus yunnanensis' Narsing Rao et al. 2020]|uniref:response regulator transcription factor n=1 Tax=Paenibacillus tengchongensis TaxID=2608684 RepID=UPI00124C6AD4|nr:response regulator transcription factor [Paenibacillus tengchongensis]
MNEVIAWFREGSGADTAQEEEPVRGVLRELGLQTAASADLEDLRLLLAGMTPVLLLAELTEVSAWEGWNLIAEIRAQGSYYPVMILSGADRSGEDAVAVFEAGGNEYLAKPVHTGEFRCRVLNLLKLTGRRGQDALLKVDGLLLDPGRRLCSRDGIELALTPKEFDLLYYLAAHLEQVCPRDEILRQVWGYHFHADTNVVDVYIKHIRTKVDRGHRNKLIHTVRGTGYVMRAPQGGATC